MWIEMEVFVAGKDGTLSRSFGKRLLNTELIEIVMDSTVYPDSCVIWYRGVDVEWRVSVPYRSLVSILRAGPVSEDQSMVIGNLEQARKYLLTQLNAMQDSLNYQERILNSHREQNARLLEENETLRRVVQNLQEVNGELRADAAKEFTAGTQYSDPHVRMALGAAIAALKEISEGDLDSQYKCAVEATKCLHVIDDTLKEGEALKKETQSKPE